MKFLNILSEALLFVLYLLYRIASTFRLTTRIESYRFWKTRTDKPKEWVFPLAFWIFFSITYFASIWWSLIVFVVLIVISIVITAINGAINVYKGLRK